MTINQSTRHELISLITRLEMEMADLQARLPAHSISPNLIAKMDELDEQIQLAKLRLAETDEDLELP